MSVLRSPLYLSLCGLLLLHSLPVFADEDATDGSAADVLEDVTDDAAADITPDIPPDVDDDVAEVIEDTEQEVEEDAAAVDAFEPPLDSADDITDATVETDTAASDDITDTTAEADTDTASDAGEASGADTINPTDGSSDSDGSAASVGPLNARLRTVARLRRFTGDLPPVTVRVQGAVEGAAEGSSGQELVVDQLAAGLYDVTWEASGFEPAASSVQVPRADVVTVTLYPDLPSSLGGRIVAPDADVSQTVLTLTGLSEMLRVEPVRTATVNADGTFQIPDLRAGVYRLDAVNGTLSARLDRLEIIGPVDLQVRLVDSQDFPGVTVSGGCTASGRPSAPWPLAIVSLAAALFVRLRRRHPVEVR